MPVQIGPGTGLPLRSAQPHRSDPGQTAAPGPIQRPEFPGPAMLQCNMRRYIDSTDAGSTGTFVHRNIRRW